MMDADLTLYHTSFFPLKDGVPPDVNLKESTPACLVGGFTMVWDKARASAFKHQAKAKGCSGYIYRTTLADTAGFFAPDDVLSPALLAHIKQRMVQEDPVFFKDVEKERFNNTEAPTMADVLDRMGVLGKIRVYRMLRDCGVKGLVFKEKSSVLFFDKNDVPALTCQPVGIVVDAAALARVQALVPPPAPAAGPVVLPQTWEEIKDTFKPCTNLGRDANPVTLWEHRTTGQKIVTKASAHAQACREEHLARQLYTAFGVDTAQTVLCERPNRDPILVMEHVKGDSLSYLQRLAIVKHAPPSLRDPAAEDTGLVAFERMQAVRRLFQLRHMVERDFPIDMLLCNYDAMSIHDANIIVRAETNTPCRIDWGSALRYHCNGALKETRGFPSLTEAFRAPSYYAIPIPARPGDSCDFSQFKWGEKTDTHILYRHNARYAGRQNQFDVLTNGEYVARLEQAKLALPDVRAIAPKDVATVIERNLDHMLRHFTALEQTSLAPRRSVGVALPRLKGSSLSS